MIRVKTWFFLDIENKSVAYIQLKVKFNYLKTFFNSSKTFWAGYNEFFGRINTIYMKERQFDLIIFGLKHIHY